MQKLIPWLSNIEHLACKFYKQCSVHFEDDEIFSGFLKSLSEDEAYHYNIMQRASSHVSKIKCDSFIKVDQELSNEIESILLENLEKIRGNNLERDDLLDTIAIIEFSEWNDLFLYVIRVLATKDDEFQYIPAKFETHRQAITHYFESIPDGKKIIESVISLNSIWNEHILIVEDRDDIAKLLTAVFRRYGNIDHAKNGAEALEMLK
ncbi:MAG: hypothetical protein GY705_03130, partial [Bacteroidetes bacterium]|nr:hypothetical protein [Bacteroidota bacterium]